MGWDGGRQRQGARVSGFGTGLVTGLVRGPYTWKRLGIRPCRSSSSRHRAKFDFRYSNPSGLGIEDEARTNEALRGIGGKRLTYRRSDEAAHA